MMKPDDLVDAITEHLFRGKKEPAEKPRRIFLSEYEVKRLLADGSKELKVPAHAILSPLALEWLEWRGIKIIKE